ncbi:serine hydrolase domain-containing protein [Paucilactobacillus wasatchensis]|uniref:Beta-lactamase class C n=1 Tax=Paucilactobacillus wasatchensis TaxID=1335616 RepID=A0A0D0Y400_9LACO|nr:serine hydrolase domain-containing protein [Paucilactobacillus wasatchensis]KIS02983.1 Beta-lactamase class C [Paucilactobacillus wasatchensis]
MANYQTTIEQLHQLVTDNVVPGVSYAIFDRKNRHAEVFGNAQLVPTKIKLWNDAKYDVASLTKVIGTTTIIMQLVERGLLKVDDPIKQYLPQFADQRVTVRHLLTHTSGIEGYIKNRNQLPADVLTSELLQLHVGANFNTHVKYADIGFIYLGWIIESFYKQPVQQVIDQQVLRPLKMTGATFHPTGQDCVPTEMQEQRGLIRGEVHDPKAYILKEHCGCAGLFATLSDLELFGHSMIENNLANLLTQNTIDQLFQDQTPMAGFHGRSFGWRVLQSRATDNHLVIYHTGFTGTWMILDRDEQQGFIMLSNRVHPSAANEEFIARRHLIVTTYLHEKEEA